MVFELFTVFTLVSGCTIRTICVSYNV